MFTKRATYVSDPENYKRYITTSDCCFESNRTKQIFTIASGFNTDLGSIPKFATWLIRPDDSKTAQPYILHDYLVAKEDISFYEANEYLFEALRAEKNSWTKSFSIYLLVMLYAWYKNKYKVKSFAKLDWIQAFKNIKELLIENKKLVAIVLALIYVGLEYFNILMFSHVKQWLLETAKLWYSQ